MVNTIVFDIRIYQFLISINHRISNVNQIKQIAMKQSVALVWVKIPFDPNIHNITIQNERRLKR